MASLTILTGGESHGPCLSGIIEGLPAGLQLNREAIDHELHRRQQGFGRGGRMRIERDTAEITSGLRFGRTLGSPLTITIRNRDWENWHKRMAVWEGQDQSPVTIPRPGHADLAGSLKYGQSDLRNILERASARETAMRVAIGAVLRQLLAEFGIWTGSHVIQIGGAFTGRTFRQIEAARLDAYEAEIRDICAGAETSAVRCADPDAAGRMTTEIQTAADAGDTLGGCIEAAALGVPAGLGSHVMWNRRLDAVLAGDLMSIGGIKAVEIGLGAETAGLPGSRVHDPILTADPPFPERASNHAGGVEGGISNGQPVIIRAVMKPIPTLAAPLQSVDMRTGAPAAAHRERSDVCAVPAASIIIEAMTAISLAGALLDCRGADTLERMKRNFSL